MKLLLFGATGATGQDVLRMALADSLISKVVAPTRRPLEAAPKLENPIIDYDALSGHEPWLKADSAICCLGTTIADAGSIAAFRKVDVEYILKAATYARRNGVTNFGLVSALGASVWSLSYYSRAKGEVEQLIRDLAFSILTIARPSVIDAPRPRDRFIERFAVRALRLFAPILPKRIHAVKPSQIATALFSGAKSRKVGVHLLHNEALLASAP